MPANSRYPGESPEAFTLRQLLGGQSTTSAPMQVASSGPSLASMATRTPAERSRNDAMVLAQLGAAPAAARQPAPEPLPAPVAAPPLDKKLFDMALKQMEGAGGKQQSIGDIVREINAALPHTSTTISGPRQMTYTQWIPMGKTLVPVSTYPGDPMALVRPTGEKLPDLPNAPPREAMVSALADGIMRAQRGQGDPIRLLDAAQRQQEFQSQQSRAPMQNLIDRFTLARDVIGDPELVSSLANEGREMLGAGRSPNRLVPVEQRFLDEAQASRPWFGALRDVLQPGQPNTKAYARSVKSAFERELQRSDLSADERARLKQSFKTLVDEDTSLRKALSRMAEISAP